MKLDAETMVAVAFDTAQEKIRRQPATAVLEPVCLIYTPAAGCVVPAGNLDMPEFLTACRLAMAASEAFGYVIVHELWVTPLAPAGERHGSVDLPESTPERMECLSIYAELRDEWIARFWRLIRGADGKVAELELLDGTKDEVLPWAGLLGRRVLH